MKTTIIFAIATLLSFGLYAQTRGDLHKSLPRTNDPVVTQPMNTEPKSRYGEIEKAPILPGTNGKYTQEWAMTDGTKVTSTFDLGTGVAMTKPLQPGAKARQMKVFEQNEQRDNSEENWECITKETRITLDNDDYMTVDNIDQTANLYPGAIYRFDNYVNGSWKSETAERNPITISTTARGVQGQSYVIVAEPNKFSIRDAVNTLTGRFGGTANGAFKMKAEEVTSQADASLKIGASGYGFGVAANYLFTFSKSEHKKYFFVDCTQELFNIDTEVPQNGFFQSPDKATKDMMYIASVTYGVRVLASIETTISSRETANKFDASYSGLVAGGSVELDAYMKNLGTHSIVKMYVVGGPQQGVYPAFNQAELISVIQGIFRNGTYASAQPIKYTFRNMEGGLVSSQSATDYFITRNCTPKPEATAPLPDQLYTVSLLNVRRGVDDDWQLYGQIWAQVYDANGHEIGSTLGNDRLFDIKKENHLSEQEGSGGYAPNLDVTFRIPAAQRPGATMTVWYWLYDYDHGSDDDFLSMRNGNMGRNKNGYEYFFRRIPLDGLMPGSNSSQKQFTDSFTDEGGDSFTEVTGSVTCQQGQ